jgi:hypothetical protein
MKEKKQIKKNLCSTSKWTQARLDLGQKKTVVCVECGMHFSKVDPEDKKTHEKYHKSKVNGIEWVLLLNFIDG